MSKTSLARPKMTAEEAQSFKSYSVGNAVLVKTGLKCGCEPYTDVFTYRRWQAQGLQVRRGERAIKLPVITERETEEDDGTTKTRRVFHTSAVFCRHQVDGANGNGGGERIPPAAIETSAPAWGVPKLHVAFIPRPQAIYFPTVPAGDIAMMQHVAQLARALYFPVLAKPYDAVSPGLDYWTGTTSAGLPDRSAWPKNTKGGLKVSPYTVKRTRHEGVRCYGEHAGSKCRRYDFAQHPSIPQAVLRPWNSHDQNAQDSFERDVAKEPGLAKHAA